MTIKTSMYYMPGPVSKAKWRFKKTSNIIQNSHFIDEETKVGRDGVTCPISKKWGRDSNPNMYDSNDCTLNPLHFILKATRTCEYGEVTKTPTTATGFHKSLPCKEPFPFTKCLPASSLQAPFVYGSSSPFTWHLPNCLKAKPCLISVSPNLALRLAKVDAW